MKASEPGATDTVDSLVAALHEGVLDEPYWSTFLDRLREHTAADYVSLVLRPADDRHQDIHIIRSDLRKAYDHSDAGQAVVGRLSAVYGQLEAGRAHHLNDIVGTPGGENSEYLDYLSRRGIKQSIVMRVASAQVGTVWLSLGRSQSEPIPRWVGTLMERLGPHLLIAARLLSELERSRLQTAIVSEAVHRLNFGWLMFDAGGQVIDIDGHAERLFQHTAGFARWTPDQPFPVRRGALAGLLAEFVDKGRTRPGAIHLVDDPWLDMLVVPAPHRPVSGGRTPVAVGYVHGIGANSEDRCDQLRQLFGLTASEARLALAMSHGRTIAEAAEELNLTVATARNYSKRIYAKTDTRGHADLVRLILASVIALS